MLNSHNRNGKGIYRLAVLLALLFGLLIIFWQRNNIYDAWRLHNYNPPSEITSLADQDKMTDQARRIFYVNHPQLVGDVSVFRSYCTVAEQTIVLGCYRAPETGIYVYNVQDNRLAGIQQVTAAHEMLHAAYDRLSSGDRTYVNSLLNDYYQNTLSDQRIIKTIDSYKKTEPKDLVDEMHSIFGTEIANLPQPLEDYYKRYFTTRSAVTSFSSNYETEFTSRENQANSLEDQLNGLKGKIDSEESALKAELSQINAQRSQLDSFKNSGQTEAYNSAVDDFNSKVDDYNAKIAAYQADVRTYNQLLKQYNQIAGDLRSLYSSIDTSLQTTATQ